MARPYNKALDGVKICPACNTEKPIEEFYVITAKQICTSWCKPCLSEQSRNYRAANKNSIASNARRYHLAKKYGITEEQYDQLLIAQNFSCAVCGKNAEEEKKRLVVDHNHKTGEIRGLLCNYCNHRIVGKWTNGNLLRQVADYIEQGTGLFVPPKTKTSRKKPRPVTRKPSLKPVNNL